VISTEHNLEGTTNLSVSSAAQQRAGADGRKIWVLMQRLSTAAQLSRYAAQAIGGDITENLPVGVLLPKSYQSN